MSPKINIARSLTPIESRRLFGWGPDIFDGAQYGLEWCSADWHCVLTERRSAVTHVGMLHHAVDVNDKQMWVGGIGGVVTVPEKQGKGYARLAMMAAREFIAQRFKVPYGLLFCPKRLVPFYSGLGWKKLNQPVYVNQAEKEVLLPLPAMILKLGQMQWPKGKVHLRSRPW